MSLSFSSWRYLLSSDRRNTGLTLRQRGDAERALSDKGQEATLPGFAGMIVFYSICVNLHASLPLQTVHRPVQDRSGKLAAALLAMIFNHTGYVHAVYRGYWQVQGSETRLVLQLVIESFATKRILLVFR